MRHCNIALGTNIIILRKLTGQECQHLERETGIQQVIYTGDDFIPVTLIEKHNARKIVLSPQETNDINQSTFNEVLHFCHTPKGNILPIDLFKHKNISYWYFLRSSVYVNYRTVVTENELLLKILVQVPAGEKTLVYGQSILQSASNTLPAGIQLIKPVYQKHSPLKTLREKSTYLAIVCLRAFFTLLKFPVFFLYRKRHMVLYDNRIKNGIFSMSGKIKQGDHNVFYLLEKTTGKKNFCNASIISPPGSTIKLKQKFSWKLVFNAFPKTWNHDFFLALTTLNPVLYSRARKLKKRIVTLKQLPVKNMRDELLTNSILKYSKITSVAMFSQAASNLLVKTFKPLSLTMTGEHNLVMMTLVNAAATRKIKTNAIQHGVMHGLHPHYVFSRADHQYFNFADTTHVWGPYWKDQLIKNNYLEKKVRVSGQMRTDCISMAGKIKKSEVIEGLGDHKKIILYIGFPHRTDWAKMREQILTDVFLAAGSLSNVELIMKPHPNEDDYENIQRLAKTAGVTNYRILQQDLFLLLMVADVVISYHSTVGSEAVMFNKPLVIANYDGADLLGYIRDGVAFETRDGQQLKTTVEGLLSGNIQPVASDITSRYAYNNNYLVDGNRTDDVITFIEAG